MLAGLDRALTVVVDPVRQPQTICLALAGFLIIFPGGFAVNALSASTGDGGCVTRGKACASSKRKGPALL